MNEIIEINGIKYKEKESKANRFPPKLSAIMLMAAAMNSYDPFRKKEPERPRVNLIEEFKLIQDKRSKLSKSQRDWVESQFHLKFTKMERKEDSI